MNILTFIREGGWHIHRWKNANLKHLKYASFGLRFRECKCERTEYGFYHKSWFLFENRSRFI